MRGKRFEEMAASFQLEVKPHPEQDRHYRITVCPVDATEGISKILLPQMKLSVQDKTEDRKANRRKKKFLIGPDNIPSLMAKVETILIN